MRVELFGDEIESLRWFSTFTQRSLAEAERIEIAPAAELDPEYRELAELAASEERDERPDIADILPVERFRSVVELIPEQAAVVLASEEELETALRDHWQDVTTSLHSDDAHSLYLNPDSLDEGARGERVAVRLSAVSADQPHSFRAQAADTAARTIPEAEPELEKLVRSGYLTVVAWAHRGEAERAAYNLARLQPTYPGRTSETPDGGAASTSPSRALREGFISPQLKLAVIPDHRLLRRRRAERPEPRPGRIQRSPTCAPATSSCTPITASAASPASTRRPSAASRATTCGSSTAARTASSSPPTSSTS